MSVYTSVAIVSTGAVAVFANISALPAQAGSDRNHGWQTRGLIEGAPLKGGANGLAFDAADRLFVANVFGGTISIIDPETGELLALQALQRVGGDGARAYLERAAQDPGARISRAAEQALATWPEPGAEPARP